MRPGEPGMELNFQVQQPKIHWYGDETFDITKH